MADTSKDRVRAATVDGAHTQDEVADGLRTIAEQGRQIAAQATALEEQLRHARGTQNIPHPLARGRAPVDEELYNRVRKMLEADPMRLAQIVDATGLHENKIKVLLTKMQREGVNLVNLGAANKALWFIPSPKVVDRLGSKRERDER